MSYWPQPDDEPVEPYPNQCEWQTFRGTLEEPPEYCEEFAITGDNFCAQHAEQDPDAARDWANEQAMESK